MTADEFWALVEEINTTSGGDMDTKDKRLSSKLSDMPTEQALEFGRRFDEFLTSAYTWDLCVAASVIQGWCSDDGFMDFRSSLISMGREVFERVVSDPESLADLDFEIVESLRHEGFQYAALLTSLDETDPLPGCAVCAPCTPSGEAWSEMELETRYPKLWKKYRGGA